MDGHKIRSYLERLCGDIDAGRPLVPFALRRALAPALIGASLALGGCPAEPAAVALYSAPEPVVGVEMACADGVDDDGDGLTDCGDPDCQATPPCLTPMPPTPPPAAEPLAVEEYGAPMVDSWPAPAPVVPSGPAAAVRYGAPFRD